MNILAGWSVFIVILLVVAVIGGGIALLVFIIKSLVDSAKLNEAVNAERQQANMYPNQPMYNQPYQNTYSNQPMYNQPSYQNPNQMNQNMYPNQQMYNQNNNGNNNF